MCYKCKIATSSFSIPLKSMCIPDKSYHLQESARFLFESINLRKNWGKRETHLYARDMHWNSLFKDVSMLSCWEVFSFEELLANFSCDNPGGVMIATLIASSSGTGTASSSSSSWASASKSETMKWPECMISRESLPLLSSFLPVPGRWKLWLGVVVVIIVNGFLYINSACIPL